MDVEEKNLSDTLVIAKERVGNLFQPIMLEITNDARHHGTVIAGVGVLFADKKNHLFNCGKCENSITNCQNYFLLIP